ncbi:MULTISPECIES: hypothetical protein [Pseudomonas aeruginosa group]|uniref:Uncharacterized protein n=1 Tax=Pseudomonas paraeruginosa (strain DSM 24068 / PA7) TaxID=381754 RepID=A6V5Y9_PSEP7|nr:MULTISPECIES: hypothetical protein [Pseudomonas aeruginosa group]ABR85986.1 hypothetical protein PSPA7_3114 [Pseudomonas aeruginosa PA7]MBH8713951.1 hypothetical protein [Pseudomonas aeruginosa]MBH9342205.1 hypothetical protein [Pseudomonas aeruginosa]MBH9400117.1 hypothetical protein [Pseudomonas aeruginosa]MBI8117040.1 hypothetical protein [Pseudomonas aeruginosa]
MCTNTKPSPDQQDAPLTPDSPAVRPERHKHDQASEAQPEFAPDDPDVAGRGEADRPA